MPRTTRPPLDSADSHWKRPQLVTGKHIFLTPGGGTTEAQPATPANTATQTNLPAARYIDLDGKQHPAVKSATEIPTGVPAYRVRLGGQRTWFIHSPNDIPATILATVDLANSKAYTFPASSSPPTSPTPQEGDLWPDTSTGSTVMHRYTSGSWVAVTEVGSNVRLVAIGSLLQTLVAGNSFNRSATGTGYSHAVYADVVLSNSAYVRCGSVASGRTVIGFDAVNTTTSNTTQDWMFEVIVATGAWTLYKDNVSVGSGTYGAVPLDTNTELRYLGSSVEAVIGGTIVKSVAATPGKSYFAKLWGYQQGTVRQIAAGYAGVDADPFATVGDNYAVDPYFGKAGTPDYSMTNFTATSSMPPGSPAATGVSCTASTGQITALPNGARFGCAPSQLLSVGAYINLVKSSGTATPDLTIGVRFYNSAGVLISTSPLYTEAFASASSGIVWRDHVVITPASTASAECYISFADKANFTAYVTGFRIGRTQAAADQSMWVEGTPEHTVQYDSTGATALTGELPKDFLVKLRTLLGIVASGVTWTYNVQEGTVNGFTSASGAKSITGSGTGTFTLSSLGTATASILITASYGGIARDTSVMKLAKFLNPPTSGGSSGGSGGTMPITKSSGFTSFSGTTFVDTTGIMSGTMPSGKTTANIGGTLSAKASSGGSAGQSWNIEGKAQRNTGTSGSPIWTDKGTTRTGTSSITEDPDSGGFLYRDPAALAFNENDTGLTGGSIYDWRTVMRINSTGSSNTTQVHTVTGSISVSAP